MTHSRPLGLGALDPPALDANDSFPAPEVSNESFATLGTGAAGGAGEDICERERELRKMPKSRIDEPGDSGADKRVPRGKRSAGGGSGAASPVAAAGGLTRASSARAALEAAGGGARTDGAGRAGSAGPSGPVGHGGHARGGPGASPGGG